MVYLPQLHVDSLPALRCAGLRNVHNVQQMQVLLPSCHHNSVHIETVAADNYIKQIEDMTTSHQGTQCHQLQVNSKAILATLSHSTARAQPPPVCPPVLPHTPLQPVSASVQAGAASPASMAAVARAVCATTAAAALLLILHRLVSGLVSILAASCILREESQQSARHSNGCSAQLDSHASSVEKATNALIASVNAQ